MTRSTSTPPAVLVTGANRGLGRAIAQAMSHAGHPVAVGARRFDDAVEAAASLDDHVVPVQLDITDQLSIDAAVAMAADRLGSIDILVNNAGGHYDLGASPTSVTRARRTEVHQRLLARPERARSTVVWARVTTGTPRSPLRVQNAR